MTLVSKGPFSTSMIMGGSVVFRDVTLTSCKFCIKVIQSCGLCLLDGGKFLSPLGTLLVVDIIPLAPLSLVGFYM